MPEIANDNWCYAAAKVAEELRESFINGNRSHVREQLDKMPRALALVVVAYIVDTLHGGVTSHNPDPNISGEIGSFLRLLLNRP